MQHSSTPEESGEWRHWSMFAALFWTGFACAGLSIIKPLIVGALVDSYGLSARQAGFIAGFEMIGIGAGALVVTALGTSWTRHVVIRAGTILALVGSFAPLCAAHFTALLLLRGLAGAGSGLIAASVLSAIGLTRNPDRTFGLYFIVVYLAAALLVPVASAVILRLGADGGYYLLAILLSTVFVSVRLIPNSSIARPTERGVLPPFPFRKGCMSAAVSVFFWIGNGAVWAFSERLGLLARLTHLQVAAILALGQVASIAGAGAAALLSTRLGRALPTFVAIALSILSLMLIGSRQAEGFSVGALLFSFAWTLFLTYLNGVMSQQDSAGRVVALSVTSQTLGMSIGPFAGGLLFASFGYESIVKLGIGCHLFAAGLLAVLVSSGLHHRAAAAPAVPTAD